MSKLIKETDLMAQARRLVEGDNPRIAVAFWGRGAASQLGLDLCGQSAQIVCNLTRGGTNPDEIERLQAAGHHVRHNPDLHAKVYLSDEEAIVGSSNASANGLSYETGDGIGWIEANIHIFPGKTKTSLDNYFNDIWNHKETKDVGKNDLVKAKEAFTKRRATGIANTRTDKEDDLLKIIKTDIDRLRDRRIYIAIYDTNVSEEAMNLYKSEKEKFQINQNSDEIEPELFEDWHDLPDGADIVCFRVGPRKGGIEYQGICHMPENRLLVSGENTSILLCFKSQLPYKVNDIKKWYPLLKKLHDEYRETPDGGYCIEIGEFYDECVISLDC